MALSRNQKKFITIKRAERRLQHRLDDIDWELDELAPAVKELSQKEAAGEIMDVTLEIGRGDEAEDQQ